MKQPAQLPGSAFVPVNKPVQDGATSPLYPESAPPPVDDTPFDSLFSVPPLAGDFAFSIVDLGDPLRTTIQNFAISTIDNLLGYVGDSNAPPGLARDAVLSKAGTELAYWMVKAGDFATEQKRQEVFTGGHFTNPNSIGIWITKNLLDIIVMRFFAQSLLGTQFQTSGVAVVPHQLSYELNPNGDRKTIVTRLSGDVLDLAGSAAAIKGSVIIGSLVGAGLVVAAGPILGGLLAAAVIGLAATIQGLGKLFGVAYGFTATITETFDADSVPVPGDPTQTIDQLVIKTSKLDVSVPGLAYNAPTMDQSDPETRVNGVAGFLAKLLSIGSLNLPAGRLDKPALRVDRNNPPRVHSTAIVIPDVGIQSVPKLPSVTIRTPGQWKDPLPFQPTAEQNLAKAEEDLANALAGLPIRPVEKHLAFIPIYVGPNRRKGSIVLQAVVLDFFQPHYTWSPLPRGSELILQYSTWPVLPHETSKGPPSIVQIDYELVDPNPSPGYQYPTIYCTLDVREAPHIGQELVTTVDTLGERPHLQVPQVTLFHASDSYPLNFVVFADVQQPADSGPPPDHRGGIRLQRKSSS